jgi:hypothetical protein
MVTGHLNKMMTVLNPKVVYTLPIGNQKIPLNPLIGKVIHLDFKGNINCIQCGRKTKKSFQQGYCYPCYQRLGDCSYCLIHPERCHHGEGNCKADNWVHTNCLTPHIVYLANSSGLKVGVTRLSQVPTRWIDQGAIQGLPIFRTANRYQAGLIEVAIKQFINDKTNWRDMLKGKNPIIDLFKEKEMAQNISRISVDKVLANFDSHDISAINDAKVTEIEYPVTEYPTKISSLSLDTHPQIEGKLMGIKGQYLILDKGVLNIRKYGGYEITLSY